MRPFPHETLEKLLESVYHNTYSSFYRTRLAPLFPLVQPLSQEQFQAIPVLTRSDIQTVPFWDRVHVQKRDVPFIRHTYGSSGSKILITPRTSYGTYTNPYHEMRMRKIMNFFASAHHEFPRSETGVQTWFGDVGNLEASCDIIAAAGIEALYTTPYTALVMVPMLEARNALSKITVLQLCGERCSPIQYATLKKKYLIASVYNLFGSSETREVVGVTCSHLREAGGSLIVESAPEIYCELLDVETGKLVTEQGVYGELVVTSLDASIPFPLIRYATGDVAMYARRECECESRTPGFEVMGRKYSALPIRLVKGELSVDAVGKALAEVLENVDYYEVHYTEILEDGSPKPRVVLRLVGSSTDSRKLAEDIADALYVFPKYTYAHGVRDKFYLPLSIEYMKEAPPAPLGKPKQPLIVRHFS